MKWTASLVIDALREAYGIAASGLVAEEWSLVTEVAMRDKATGRNERRCDALIVRNWRSGIGHRRIAIEVKVSRSDYRNETDSKRAPAEAMGHQTVYAAPAGLIDPRTLPPGWGLIEVYDTVGAAMRGPGQPVGKFNSRCTWRTKAVIREPSEPLDHLVSELARRASRSEERVRRATDGPERVSALEAEVERLAGIVGRRDMALRRERARHRRALSVLAATEGMQDCADCEHRIRWDPVRDQWLHVDRDQGQACMRARQDAVRAEREAATGAAYLRGPVGPIEPRAVREACRDAPDEALSPVDSLA